MMAYIIDYVLRTKQIRSFDMALPELKTINLPDAKISYREMGAGPSIVFLHGLAGNSQSWEGQFDHFSSFWINFYSISILVF